MLELGPYYTEQNQYDLVVFFFFNFFLFSSDKKILFNS